MFNCRLNKTTRASPPGAINRGKKEDEQRLLVQPALLNDPILSIDPVSGPHRLHKFVRQNLRRAS
jgi:hypothetical protein